MVGSDSVAGTKTGGLFTTPENAFDAFGTGAGVEFLGCFPLKPIGFMGLVYLPNHSCR